LICYHGTSEENYKKILLSGIKKGSYFTPFLFSAITMGGPYVFAVDLPHVTNERLGKSDWEFFNNKIIKIKDILSITKHDMKLILYNSALSTKLTKQQIESEGKIFCKKCKGKGELTYIDNGHHLLPGGCRFDVPNTRTTNNIVTCPKCKGFGYLNKEI
jgi:hypothetical protein